MLRKLDALFAERVLGRSVRLGHVSGILCSHPTDCTDASPAPDGCEPLPSYTTDLSAAWEGVAKAGPNIKIIGPEYAGWQVEIFDIGAKTMKGRATAIADTPTLAIVLACLLAVGVTEEEQVKIWQQIS